MALKRPKCSILIDIGALFLYNKIVYVTMKESVQQYAYKQTKGIFKKPFQ